MSTPDPGQYTVFPDLAASVVELRRDRLVSALQNLMPGLELSDEYLMGQLLSAEKSIERALRVSIIPREIVPYTDTATIAALEAAGTPYATEAGYDYEPGLFSGDTWGRIETRQRPILAVHRISFAYPGMASRVWEVPVDWVRMDGKYGVINLVPSNTGASVPLSSYLLQVLGGGGNVPLMVQIAYRAGLANVARDYPDLLSLIKRQAVCDVLGDQFIPSSASTSGDGLSQSISFSIGDHEATLDKKLERLRKSILGIRLMVL